MGHMRRHFRVFHGRQEFMPLAEMIRCPARAISQHISKPLTSGNQLHGAHHGCGITEMQRVANLLSRQDAPGETLHGPGNRRAGADGVQALLVAHLVCVGYGVKIADPARGAQHSRRLILRPTVLRSHRMPIPGRLHDGFAAHSASEARMALIHDGGSHALAGQGVEIVKLALTVVAVRQRASPLAVPNDARGAVFVKCPDVGIISKRLHAAPGQFLHALGVGNGDPPRPAAHHNGLQSLGTHHRTEARPAIRTVGHVDDGSKPRQSLSGRPTLRDFDPFIPQLAPEDLLHLSRGPAPKVSGIANLSPSFMEPEVHRRARLPVNDDAIKTGKLHICGEEPATL